MLLLKMVIGVLHLLGLALGLGSAALLDLIVLRFLVFGKVGATHVEIAEFASKIVAVGLGLLWASGAGFLVYYWIADPGALLNPKIWAKLAIVVVLTLNGFFIHRFVLATLHAQVGKRLLDGVSHRRRMQLLLVGTASAVSWCVPFLLGALPALNFIVPAGVILLVYASALAIAFGIVVVVVRELTTVRIPIEEYDKILQYEMILRPLAAKPPSP